MEPDLEVAVSRLDGTVLVSNAGIVAGRLEAVMQTECGIGPGLVLAIGPVAVSRREAVGAMLAGHAAQLPERLLEAFGQRGEALPAADRLDEAPARVGEPEMVDQMREGLAGNGDPELGSVGEVGQGLAPRRVLLTATIGMAGLT
jgi:hypothetical protein